MIGRHEAKPQSGIMDQSFFLLNELLKAQICQRLSGQGRRETAVPGLAISRYNASTSPERCLCSPMIAYVVQGNKHSFYGDWETCYGAGQCVVLGIDVPGIFQISDATPDQPFISLSVRLDNQIISSLFNEMAISREVAEHACAPLGVMDVDFELLDSFRRLVNLLDHPERIAILAPMIIREIHYYVLSGRLGRQLCLFNTSGTKSWQIRCSINWLRENYRDDLEIPELAKQASMASSTFNKYFRQVTGLSPLQFQKRLRLHEAERLMLVENYDASTAAHAVGYGSVSQFSREYKRLFGAPPKQYIIARQIN